MDVRGEARFQSCIAVARSDRLYEFVRSTQCVLWQNSAFVVRTSLGSPAIGRNRGNTSSVVFKSTIAYWQGIYKKAGEPDGMDE